MRPARPRAAALRQALRRAPTILPPFAALSPMLKFWKKKPAELPVDPAADVLPANFPQALPEQVMPLDAPAEVPAEPEPPPPASVQDDDWGEKLRQSGFARGFATLFTRHPKLDEALVEEIETTLLTADVGVAASTAIAGDLRVRMERREFADSGALLRALRSELAALLAPVAEPLLIPVDTRPFVILTVGVNGVGKTTTIGKLARRYQQQGREVVLAAGDTFRAAAVEQLRSWGERHQIQVVHQGSNADSASVIFDALQSAKARDADLMIADTAGRLHTQTGLMEELSKIRRVLGKIDPSAPHEVLMVIDGTTGQNAISQVRQFREAAGVTGLVVTKLDGTAKGGVLFALAREFGLPIRYVGLGERVQDLRAFDVDAFLDALLPESLAQA